MPSSATRQWLEKASEDEAVVGLLRTHGGPWSVAAYHVQQAAEKYIKAALVEAGIAPPKTHDLQQLLGLHPGGGAGPLVQQAAAMVSAYAWLTRYPGAPTIGEVDVTRAEADLALIRSWAVSVIP